MFDDDCLIQTMIGTYADDRCDCIMTHCITISDGVVGTIIRSIRFVTIPIRNMMVFFCDHEWF